MLLAMVKLLIKKYRKFYLNYELLYKIEPALFSYLIEVKVNTKHHLQQLKLPYLKFDNLA